MIIFVMGCFATDNEWVVGKDIPALRIDGSPSSGFGHSLAADAAGVLVGSLYSNEVSLYDWDGSLLDTWSLPILSNTKLMWVDSVAYAWSDSWLWTLQEGQPPVRAEDSKQPPSVCDDAFMWPSGSASVALRCFEDRIVEKECLGKMCVLSELGETIAETTFDADFYLSERGLCWGIVDEENENDAGQVLCESGVYIKGFSGERVGQSLTEDWTTGRMSRQLSPPRGRIYHLDSDNKLTIESGSDSEAYGLAQYQENLIIGVATAQREEQRGAIWFLKPSF